MKAVPIGRPSIELTMKAEEADAILRALGRLNITAGPVDVQRLGALRSCIEGALAGATTSCEVER